jgi:hypothetical protein
MATSLSVPSILARVQWSFTDSRAWADSTNAASFSYAKTLTNGTGASQSDKIYILSTTLAGGATLNVDLAGSVTDIYGNTITMARIKVIYLEVTTDTAGGPVLLGGHATAAIGNWVTATPDLDTAQPKVRVRNGGCFLLACTDATGYAVTATTDDMLTLENESGGTAATYKLVVIGASA